MAKGKRRDNLQMMTQDEFARQSKVGNICPKCGSRRVEAGEVEESDSRVDECLECGYTYGVTLGVVGYVPF